MTTYQFLTDRFDDNGIFYAISKDRIKTIPLSGTYTDYGQCVDPGEAGDGVTLLTQKAVDIANAGWEEQYGDRDDFDPNKWNIGDTVYANNEGMSFDYIVNSYSELIEGSDIEWHKLTCEGFNYHDGHNWKTVSVACDYAEVSHDLVTDEKLIRSMNRAIKNRNYFKEEFGKRYYESRKYEIVQTQFPNDFSAYQITLK